MTSLNFNSQRPRGADDWQSESLVFFEVDSDSVEVDSDCASDRGRAGAIVPPAIHRDYVPALIGVSRPGGSPVRSRVASLPVVCCIENGAAFSIFYASCRMASISFRQSEVEPKFSANEFKHAAKNVRHSKAEHISLRGAQDFSCPFG